MTGKPLGELQKAVLLAFLDHGGQWVPGGQWNWTTHRETLRIVESLARRGLVEEVPAEKVWSMTGNLFRLTEAGRQVLGGLQAQRLEEANTHQARVAQEIATLKAREADRKAKRTAQADALVALRQRLNYELTSFEVDALMDAAQCLRVLQ